jgi:hypothetical protein
MPIVVAGALAQPLDERRHRGKGVLRQRKGEEMERQHLWVLLRAGIALIVGIVSGTMLRHRADRSSSPLIVRWPATGAYAALPIFFFWSWIVYLSGYSANCRGSRTVTTQLEII